jgi:hypothetical protein
MEEPKTKIIDVSGIPFIVELRADKYYIVGIKVRKRLLNFETGGLPVEVVDKIVGRNEDGKVNTLEELLESTQNLPEGTDLKEELDNIPDEFVSDEEMTGAWEEILQQAKENAKE